MIDLVFIGSLLNRFLILLRQCSDSTKPAFFLEIVETNPFKHLCHLSLMLTEGNEYQIKKHLSRKLQHLKEEKEGMVKMIRSLEQQMESERKTNGATTTELDNLKAQFQTKIMETEQTLRLELQTEKHLLYQSKCDLEQQIKLQQLEAVKKETQWQQQLKEMNDTRFDLENNIK